MKKILFYAASLVAVATACNKINSEPVGDVSEPASGVKMIIETVTARQGTSTKATISDTDASFAWTAGDNIAVHVSNGKYVYTSDEGASGASEAAAKASFTVAYPEGTSRDAFAVYPSTIVAKDAANYGQEGHTLDVTLPDSYTLAQVSGVTSQGPMIATNTPGDGWDFYQLCGMLRLTINSIPATAKRLEIDFNGKKVCGNFSIAAPVTPNTSNIATDDDATKDCITITKDGTNATLGATSLVVNVPLPAGTYSKITVIAYDALSGGKALMGKTIPFAYTASNQRGVKKAATLGDLQSTFNFTFKNSDATLTNVRFARVFSVQNKLHNETSYGPFTASGDTDLASPISTPLRFDENPGDQLAFQVVTGDGKVYSGLADAPAGGYGIGETYNVTADVKAYTFTVAGGKKVYFSPGDLGVDNSVYSFTEPFTTWGWDASSTSTAKRVWFDYSEVNYRDVSTGHDIYGIKWRNPKCLTTSTTSPTPQEWDGIIGRTNMNSGVSAYYRATVSGNVNYLLLPPDETQSADIGDDLTSGNVTNYAKYLGKGFVLLMRTGRAIANSSGLSWGINTEGWYWALWNNMSNNRTYFYWTDSGTPCVSWAGNQFRMRVRYVRDVE